MVDISIISISALDLERMELRVEIYMDQVIGFPHTSFEVHNLSRLNLLNR